MRQTSPTFHHPPSIWDACWLNRCSGAVACLDPTRPWWIGTRDVEDRLGIEIDYGAFEAKQLHFVVGGTDTET